MNPRFDTCYLGTVYMAFILSVIIPSPAVALSVRVQDTPGGPQIHVDGKPAGMGPKVTMSLKQGETRVLKY